MIGIAGCDHPYVCGCIQQSFREMKQEIELLKDSAICLSQFAMSIPELLVKCDYLTEDQKNRLWDDIVAKMTPKAQKEYRERLQQILYEKDQANVF